MRSCQYRASLAIRTLPTDPHIANSDSSSTAELLDHLVEGHVQRVGRVIGILTIQRKETFMAVLHIESLVIGDSKEVIGNEDRDTLDIWRQKRICPCCIF